MKKKIISAVLFLLCIGACVGAYYKYTNHSEDDDNVPYVMDMDGNWVKYAFFETNDYYGPNEDFSGMMKDYFYNNVDGKYCFSHYAPHGDLWNLYCYDTKKLCQSELDSEIADTMIVDAKKCYQVHLVDAWCMSSVKTGLYRYYDDNTYGEILAYVCTKTKAQCESLKEFRFNKQSECVKQVVLSNKNVLLYMWSDDEVKNLIKQNKQAKPLVFRE